MRKRAVIIIVGILSAVLLLSLCVYFFFPTDAYKSAKTWLGSEARYGNYARDIGTNKDMWFNGYLGLLFRFKIYGWLNWLAIPLALYFLFTLRKRRRWEIALFLALCMASILLAYKGYRNYRYQLTLFPVLITIIFLFGWQILKEHNKKVVNIVFLLCVTMFLGNCYSQRDKYQYYWNAGIGNGKPGEQFPYKLITYINEQVDDDAVILERDQPILYYYASKKEKLRGQGKSKYILIRGGSIAGYDLVCEDQGYKLYKKREARVPNNLTIKYFNKKKPDFKTNFSDWRGKDEVSIGEISKAIVHMVDLGRRGEYNFRRISSEEGNLVRVMLKETWFNKKPKIQFGYYVSPNGLRLKVKEGDIVSVIASVRLSKQAGRAPELFVQDKTDYWTREKIYWSGNKWHDVLVSKKIRDGFTDICMGIYWEPESVDEWLEIKSIRVYVSAKNR